jgi:hypothetical protein
MCFVDVGMFKVLDKYLGLFSDVGATIASPSFCL